MRQKEALEGYFCSVSLEQGSRYHQEELDGWVDGQVSLGSIFTL